MAATGSCVAAKDERCLGGAKREHQVPRGARDERGIGDEGNLVDKLTASHCFYCLTCRAVSQLAVLLPALAG